MSALFQLPGRAGLPLPLPLPITPTLPLTLTLTRCAEKCPPPGACTEKLCECTVSEIKRKAPFAPCDKVLRADGSCAGDDALAPGHFVSPSAGR